ncbi:MAG: hypothetical protein A2W91_02775 [Bacteroidetes bacterium GWF2_38_335]|nr:MAG: hypothetical protein A2W91_02775 [Bacteroidetes bacterium GWF2_38_335]OFY77582.1 MAG: hypothetical protein A2281_01985 [Bacteroidetes bacterium RIFOXYA12_FULL_38_20]HBS87117.1 hypothetical protein [Bacteroidales bacterium]
MVKNFILKNSRVKHQKKSLLYIFAAKFIQMKRLKIISALLFSVVLVNISACSGGPEADGKKYADLMCKLKGFEKDLTKAYENDDQETIKTLTGELKDLEKEMIDLGNEIKEKYKADEEGNKKAEQAYKDAMEKCENN